jgi:hypothetical protein
MIEILAHVPTPPMKIKFLNRKDRQNSDLVIVLERNGESPEQFMRKSYDSIDSVFANRPGGLTPYLRALQNFFAEGAGKKVARY